jgi:anti-sigma factor RsiW
MKEWNCDEVLERLPELARGQGELQGPEVFAHLESCTNCREEWEMVSLLMEAGAAPVPSTLEARLKAAVRADVERAADRRPVRRARSVPTWRLAAAAGIVLAIATPILVDRMADGPVGTLNETEVTAALGDRLPSPWLDDEEGLVAGAPVLDGLSDEALEQLLEEMGG